MAKTHIKIESNTTRKNIDDYVKTLTLEELADFKKYLEKEIKDKKIDTLFFQSETKE